MKIFNFQIIGNLYAFRVLNKSIMQRLGFHLTGVETTFPRAGRNGFANINGCLKLALFV